MKKSLQITPWLLALAFSGIAAADEVVLKNGSKLEGAVREEGDKVIVDVGSGTITIDRSQVRSISKPEDQIQEFDRRMQSVKPDDANGYYQLHLWARQQPGMKTRADGLLKKILEIDPNDEPARRALGYVNYKGAWLTQDEHKAALGLVRYQGGWMTAEGAERLRRIDRELEMAKGKQAADEERLRQQLSLERERITQRARFMDMLSTGQVPRDVAAALGYPWAMRYWGPATPAAPQPNAD